MLTTLITGAPDLWVEPAAVSTPDSAIVAALLAVPAIVSLVLTFALFISGYKGALWSALAFVVLGLTVLWTSSVANIEYAAGAAARDAVVTAYADEVSDWLDDSYGISASDDAIWRLIDGETLATDYDGDRIVISFTTTSDDELALVDENLALVPELGR